MPPKAAGDAGHMFWSVDDFNETDLGCGLIEMAEPQIAHQLEAICAEEDDAQPAIFAVQQQGAVYFYGALATKGPGRAGRATYTFTKDDAVYENEQLARVLTDWKKADRFTFPAPNVTCTFPLRQAPDNNKAWRVPKPFGFSPPQREEYLASGKGHKEGAVGGQSTPRPNTQPTTQHQPQHQAAATSTTRSQSKRYPAFVFLARSRNVLAQIIAIPLKRENAALQRELLEARRAQRAAPTSPAAFGPRAPQGIDDLATLLGAAQRRRAPRQPDTVAHRADLWPDYLQHSGAAALKLEIFAERQWGNAPHQMLARKDLMQEVDYIAILVESGAPIPPRLLEGAQRRLDEFVLAAGSPSWTVYAAAMKAWAAKADGPEAVVAALAAGRHGKPADKPPRGARGSGAAGATCFTCGATGHFAKACPKKK